MKKNSILSFIFFVAITLISLLCSCHDIFEPSIKNSTVTLEAPANNDTTTTYAVNFWWDQVSHALSYHLQVVSGTFLVPNNLVLDTIITNYKFTYSLNPGKYQWRVTAENGSSQTANSLPHSLFIALASIKTQSVLLQSPSNNYFTNQNPIIFKWNSIYGAKQYRFEIDTNNFANESTIVTNSATSATQISFNFPKAQAYQWRVRAENDTAQSQWSVINAITFNNIPPAQVVLAAPTKDQTISKPVALQWNSVSNAAHYKLYVFKSDSTTTYNSNFPVLLTSKSYSFNIGNSGDKVYWKVSAIDAEGNEGNASVLSNFTIQ